MTSGQVPKCQQLLKMIVNSRLGRGARGVVVNTTACGVEGQWFNPSRGVNIAGLRTLSVHSAVNDT